MVDFFLLGQDNPKLSAKRYVLNTHKKHVCTLRTQTGEKYKQLKTPQLTTISMLILIKEHTVIHWE